MRAHLLFQSVQGYQDFLVVLENLEVLGFQDCLQLQCVLEFLGFLKFKCNDVCHPF